MRNKLNQRVPKRRQQAIKAGWLNQVTILFWGETLVFEASQLHVGYIEEPL